MLEFFEDLWEADKESFEDFRVDGETDAPVLTGDPVIDDLERRMAAGEEIGIEELEEAFGDTEVPKSKGKVEADKTQDDYTDLTAPQPQ